MVFPTVPTTQTEIQSTEGLDANIFESGAADNPGLIRFESVTESTLDFLD